MMRWLLCALVLFLAQASEATTWYVQKTGSDSNSCLVPDTLPCLTIGAAYTKASAGDTIRVDNGIYREILYIAKANLTIRKMADGTVYVDASAQASGWVVHSGNVYKKTGWTDAPTSIMSHGLPTWPEFSLGAVDAPGEWYYDSGATTLYLWSNSSIDPDLEPEYELCVVKDGGITDGVTVDAVAGVTLKDITFQCSEAKGILATSATGFTCDGCTVRHSAYTGIHNYAGSANVIKNSEVYYCYDDNWPRGRYKFGAWGSGTSMQGPDSIVEDSIVHNNGGEGILTYNNDRQTVRRNIVYDNWSVNVYTDNHVGPDVIERNLIYCNTPDLNDARNNGDAAPADGSVFRRMRAEGIMTADENYGAGSHLTNVTIRNNIISGCRRGITHYGPTTGSGLKQQFIYHNTIITPTTLNSPYEDPANNAIAGMALGHNSGNNSGSIVRNNIVFVVLSSSYLLYRVDSPGSGDQFAGLTIDNNLLYAAAGSTPYHWGPSSSATYDYTHTQWVALTGTNGANDVLTNPLLLNYATLTPATDKYPDANSPAKNTGLNVSVTTDYAGTTRPQGIKPDIGAYELDAAAAAQSIMALIGRP